MSGNIPETRGTLSLSLVLLAALAVGACDAGETGEVRVVHLGPRASAVDVGFDGERRVDGLAFPNASAYLEALAGELRLRVVPNQGSAVLVDKEISMPAGGAVTLFLTETQEKFTSLLASDERSPAASALPRLRFINAGLGSAALTLKSGSTALVSSLGRGALSSYISLKETSPTLELVEALSGAAVLKTKPLSLAQGGAYTLALYPTGPSATANPPLLRLYGDSLGSTAAADLGLADGNLMFVHASPGADAITAYVDGKATTSSALKFQEASGYAAVASGRRYVSLRVSTGGATVYSTYQVIRSAGNYTVVAYDLPTRLKVLLLEDDFTAPATGRAMLRFLHLDPAASTLDVKVSSDVANLFTGIKYQGASPFASLPAGSLALEVRAASDGKLLKSLPAVQLKDGESYSLMARPPETGTDLTVDWLVHK